MDGVTPATPRPDTSTWALEFSGDAVVTVATEEQPAAETINDGFTIRYSMYQYGHVMLLDASQDRMENLGAVSMYVYCGVLGE